MKGLRNLRSIYGRLVPRNFTWSFAVKSEVKLAVMILRIVPLVFGQLSASRVKVTWGFATNVAKLHRSSGPKGLALYLKTSSVLLQQIAGGMKAESPWGLGCNVARTRSGVPRIINGIHRKEILSGNPQIVRLWLSLFGLYRVIEFKGALKLKTITAPGVDPILFIHKWTAWAPRFLELARRHTGDSWKLVLDHDLTVWSFPFIRKSSPNSRGFASSVGLCADIVTWAGDSELRARLDRWLVLTDSLDLKWALKALFSMVEKIGLESLSSNLGKTYLGRLGFKIEPGKIRVFAMVDLLTQAIMQPLHDWIFSKLALIKQDGTFDQGAPVERLLEWMVANQTSWSASYDLSAATDRLPVVIQVELLKPLLGDEMALLWADLLTKRAYVLPKIAKSYNLGFNEVRYAVGQPMGALSSWAMLAMTHHAIVQAAADSAYPKRTCWFAGYAVLGDDVVIADRRVAAEYLRIMSELGVEIGLSKSLISDRTSIEFAKRTWIRGREASPLSLAECLVAVRHLGALQELAKKCMKYGVIRLSSVARFAGFSYRMLGSLPVGLALGNRLSRLLAYLTRPGGLYPLPFEAWLTALGPGREGNVTPHRVWPLAERVWECFLSTIIGQSTRFSKTLYEGREAIFADASFMEKDKKDPKGPRVKSKIFGSSYLPEMFTVVNSAVLNLFFTEWIAYPFTERLTKKYDEIEHVLCTLDPTILPEWNGLEELWKQVFELEDGLAALPKRIDYFQRETDEVTSSTRIVNLWKSLRSLALREVQETLSIREAGPVYRRTARRRRRGG